MDADLASPAADPAQWLLEPGLLFLNHGSFGSCPREVLAHQLEWRDRMERQPVQFFVRDLERLLDSVRERVGRFLQADPEGLALVSNVTSGVNAVLRSLPWQPGDEILVTNQEYNACRNAARIHLERAGGRLVTVPLPFPVADPGNIVDALLSAVTPRTRLLLIDHISSQTALVLPVQQIVQAFDARGIDTLVDGAHAPGQVELDLESLGAAYYTGNFHKWVCAPKGAAFLQVRKDRRQGVHPTSISHGANSTRTDRSRYLIEFDWTGTRDPSAVLSVPFALDYFASLGPEGWPGLMARNHRLAVQARKKLAQVLRVDLPCPDSMVGAMASLPLPDDPREDAPASPLYGDPLQTRLLQDWNIEVPVIPWPQPPKRLIRVSCQLYNGMTHYERLAEALESLFPADPAT